MASFNRVILLGNLGKDPVIRDTTTGKKVATFSLATNEPYKKDNGEWDQRSEWHNITVWGRLAELAGERLAKGKSVLVEGSLRTRKYTDKNSVEKYITEIVVTNMQFLDKSGAPVGPSHAAQADDLPSGTAGAAPTFEPDDDIPF